MGLCPMHDDHEPSFRVDTVGGRCNCFSTSCRLNDPRGLDVIELYGRLHNLDNKDAIRALAAELGLVARRHYDNDYGKRTRGTKS